MLITAKRQICGDYGTLVPGKSADVRYDLAQELIRSGLAIETPAAVPQESKPSGPTETPAQSVAADVAGPTSNKSRGRG